MRGLAIKRGDALTIPVPILIRGQALAAQDVERAAFSIGDALTLEYPGAVTYEDGRFMVPLTQTDTFALKAGRPYPVDVRAKLCSGDVLGTADPPILSVTDAISEEVL